MGKLYVLQLQKGSFKLNGPIPFIEIIDQLKENTFSWMDLIYDPEHPDKWKRLADVPELREALAKWPSREFLNHAENQISPKSTRESTRRTKTGRTGKINPNPLIKIEPDGPWYLQTEGKELGPLSPAQLLRLLSTKTFSDQLFAWCKGLSTWIPVESPKHFHKFMKNPEQLAARFNQDLIEKDANLRGAPRRSLVATVRIVNSRYFFGICMDVSTSGMQLHIDSQCPLQNYETYELDIFPASTTKLKTFSVKARVMWKTEDKMGLQFLEINDAQKNAVDRYVLKTQKGYEL